MPYFKNWTSENLLYLPCITPISDWITIWSVLSMRVSWHFPCISFLLGPFHQNPFAFHFFSFIKFWLFLVSKINRSYLSSWYFRRSACNSFRSNSSFSRSPSSRTFFNSSARLFCSLLGMEIFVDNLQIIENCNRTYTEHM